MLDIYWWMRMILTGLFLLSALVFMWLKATHYLDVSWWYLIGFIFMALWVDPTFKEDNIER